MVQHHTNSHSTMYLLKLAILHENESNTQIPVSYTHLDVYKRQKYYSAFMDYEQISATNRSGKYTFKFDNSVKCADNETVYKITLSLIHILLESYRNFAYTRFCFTVICNYTMFQPVCTGCSKRTRTHNICHCTISVSYTHLLSVYCH